MYASRTDRPSGQIFGCNFATGKEHVGQHSGNNERVGAFGQRAELQQDELADVGRAVTNSTMIVAMLSGWLKERPEWDAHSIRTTFSVNETVQR
jgi:hypothetical protein